MSESVMSEPATWIVALILLALVAAAVIKLRHDRKKGRGQCGSGCDGCSYREDCGRKDHVGF